MLNTAAFPGQSLNIPRRSAVERSTQSTVVKSCSWKHPSQCCAGLSHNKNRTPLRPIDDEDREEVSIPAV